MLQKRQRIFQGKISRENLEWLEQNVGEFHLEDHSKAAVMVLDYAVQETGEEDLFPASAAGSFPAESTSEEKAYVLDVSHIQWLESTSSKLGFASTSAVLDYVITQFKTVKERGLIFEIDRSQNRVREASVRFSIKS